MADTPTADAPAEDDDLPAPATGRLQPAPSSDRSGAMIALMLPRSAAADLALPGGLPPAELHLTVLYLGTAADLPEGAADQVVSVLTATLAGQRPIAGTVAGIGRFSGAPLDPVWAAFDSPDLERLRALARSAAQQAGITPPDNHGFTPHITLGYLAPDAPLPVQRLDPVDVTVPAVSVVIADARTNIPLSAPPMVLELSTDPALATEPLLGAGVKGKPSAPPLGVGSFVSWSGGYGRIDMIVTSGKVPGVSDDVTGTTSKPAARVVVYEEQGGTWKSTGKRVAMALGACRRAAPPKKTKTAADDNLLVGLFAAHEDRVVTDRLPAWSRVTGAAVKTVYDRGLAGWPGSAVTPLSANEWATGRVKAFLSLAAGDPPPAGYRRDDDLLHADHPRAQPAAATA